MSSRLKNYLPRVLLILPENAPSATIYIIKPLRELARRNKLIFEKMLETEVTLAQIHASDLVLFSRNREPASNWILEECLSRNIPTIYDLDDNFWEVPFDLPYAKYYRAPERLRQLEYYLSSVDLVRVYSHPLFDRVEEFNHNVCLVKPCIDMNLVPVEPLPRKSSKIRITYVTGRGGSDALISLFSDDLLKLFETHPNRIEMYWWGEIPDAFVGLSPVNLIPIIHDYDEYLHNLSRDSFDIGLAPLTPSDFNLSKTNTKFRDYGASRIAGIYSNVAVYSSCVEHERTGVLVDNQPGAWFEAISRLVEDGDLRMSIKDVAYQFVYEHYRQEYVEQQWEELIKSILKAEPYILSNQEPHSLPSLSKLAKISLGNKEVPPGFIGVNRYPNPSVNVIADINYPLPFASNTADLLLVEHSLEYVDSLDNIIREIYRVSKHRAQVCILAPYSQPSFETSDSNKQYHFNEGTIKHWTTAASPVEKRINYTTDTAEYTSHESSSSPNIDLRCLRIEFFYTPEFLHLRSDEKQVLRQERPGVCDLALYHFAAIKETLEDEEIKLIAKLMDYFEPISITIRRLEDTNAILKSEFDLLLRKLKVRETDLHNVQNSLATNRAELEQTQATMASKQAELDQTHASLALKQAELEHTQTTLALKQSELAQTRTAVESKQTELEQAHTALASKQAEIEQAHTTLASKQAETEMNQITLIEKNKEYEELLHLTKIAAQDLDSFRSRRLSRLIERVMDRTDVTNNLSPAFQQLKDDSLFYSPRLAGYYLQPSITLQRVKKLTYPLMLNQAGLCELVLAPILEISANTGVIGIELTSPVNQVVAQTEVPASQIVLNKPVCFNFPPIQESSKHLELSVFVHDLDVPLRIYEWRKYPPLGIGHIETRPFCAFAFLED